jgi:hypothetical protein
MPIEPPRLRIKLRIAVPCACAPNAPLQQSARVDPSRATALRQLENFFPGLIVTAADRVVAGSRLVFRPRQPVAAMIAGADRLRAWLAFAWPLWRRLQADPAQDCVLEPPSDRSRVAV